MIRTVQEDDVAAWYGIPESIGNNSIFDFDFEVEDEDLPLLVYEPEKVI